MASLIFKLQHKGKLYILYTYNMFCEWCTYLVAFYYVSVPFISIGELLNIVDLG